MKLNRKKNWLIVNQENKIIEKCRLKGESLNRIKELKRIYIGYKLKIIKNEKN